MKTLLLIIVAAIMCVGCTNRTKELPGRNTDLPLVATVDTVHSFGQPILKPTISFSSPSLFGGCSFGNAFMSFLRVQDYTSCLKYTSVGTIHKYGAAAMLKTYKSLKVNYTLHLLSIISCRDTTVMRYKANEFATSRFKEFKVVVENDTCRLVIDNIREFLK
jgi:hypothetical protein